MQEAVRDLPSGAQSSLLSHGQNPPISGDFCCWIQTKAGTLTLPAVLETSPHCFLRGIAARVLWRHKSSSLLILVIASQCVLEGLTLPSPVCFCLTLQFCDLVVFNDPCSPMCSHPQPLHPVCLCVTPPLAPLLSLSTDCSHKDLI